MKYDDIINKTRPSSKHPSMSEYDRAAQFAPFAALTGYAEAINECGRVVDKKIELSEYNKELISTKLQYIIDNINSNIECIITYFIKDELKDGGRYNTIKCIIKKVNLNDRIIQTYDKIKISIDDISNIIIDIFE